MYPSCHNNNYLHNTQKVIWTDYGILYSHYMVIQKTLELFGFWIKKILKYGAWVEWNSKYRWTEVQVYFQPLSNSFYGDLSFRSALFEI